MDCEKIGAFISAVRKEKGMTQKDLGEKLGVSDKAISKWERGRGLPELSLLSDLADALQVTIETVLSGGREENTLLGGNMKKVKYFVCPTCHNLIWATNEATVSCCGHTLAALTPQKAREEEKLTMEQVEDEWFISSDHPMTKDHYIAFAAFATGERLEIIKLYPEWSMSFRLSAKRRDTLLWYCTKEGLYYQNILSASTGKSER